MRANWVRLVNYHVTLRFLGDIEPLLTLDLEKLSRRITASTEPFSLSLDRLGCFPSVDKPRVLWVGGDVHPAFRALVSSLDYELRKLGFPSDRKPTIAHITLARIKGRVDANLPQTLDAESPGFDRAIEVIADRIVLMESVLGPGGPTYTPLSTTHFKGASSDGN